MACNSCNNWSNIAGINFPDFVSNSCCNPCCDGSVAGTNTDRCRCHHCCGCGDGSVAGTSTCGCHRCCGSVAEPNIRGCHSCRDCD